MKVTRIRFKNWWKKTILKLVWSKQRLKEFWFRTKKNVVTGLECEGGKKFWKEWFKWRELVRMKTDMPRKRRKKYERNG
jgi:hypothetical protein